jgi:glycosyltransferase involved in cell wall biosynthesis
MSLDYFAPQNPGLPPDYASHLVRRETHPSRRGDKKATMGVAAWVLLNIRTRMCRNPMPSRFPMISVIMPAYNSEDFIAAAIDSILSQTFTDFELIISDDGSRDGTLEIARSYAARDKRIRVLSGENVGAAENGNRCLRAATRPWVARMDADDISFPDRLERLADAVLEHPEVVLWGGRAVTIDRRGRQMRRIHRGPVSAEEYEEFRAQGKVIYVISPTCLFRRDLALELGGYDPAMDGADDVELMNGIAERGPVRTIPHDLAFYRIHGGSVTSTRYMLQERVFAFLSARNEARLRGLDLSIETYQRDLDEQPALRRLVRSVGGFGRNSYRNTVVHVAERRFIKATLAAGLAIACNPRYALNRTRNRMLSN